ncbi:MAG: hypothetical protein WCF85_14570 [Rhodospirillaceae bacterium]
MFEFVTVTGAATAQSELCTQAEPGLKLAILDRNQFWFILPDGKLPDPATSESVIPNLRSAAGRAAVLQVRTVFLKDAVLFAEGREQDGPVRVEFQPCRIGHKKEEGAEAPAGSTDMIEIPDIGELLTGLGEVEKSLEVTDSLLAGPAALTCRDEAQRQALNETISLTRDRVLTGLSELGTVLTLSDGQSREDWQAQVSAAAAAAIEAMIAFDDLADHVREDKIRELTTLRSSIERYFRSVDPSIDIDACHKFSRGINKLILGRHKQALTLKKDRIDTGVEGACDRIISSLQRVMPHAAGMASMPRPFILFDEGCYTKFVLNMAHMVLAVENCGLSIRLDTDRHSRLHRELRGWDSAHPPRLHVTDRRRFEALRQR